MNSEELKQRTKSFAIRIIRMVATLPNRPVGKVLGFQIIKSATSVAANYRSSCRAKSRRDFIAKIKTVEEESDETLFWLEIIHEIELVSRPKLTSLLKEANELTAIFSASSKTAKGKAMAPKNHQITKSKITKSSNPL